MSSAFQQATLTAADAAGGDQFGYSVAISGSTAVVGAPYKNSNTGAAYVFVGSSGNWSQQAELTAKDGAPGDQFGWSVAISGSTVVVGAWHRNSGRGAAYVFVRRSGRWSRQAKLTAKDAAPRDRFGWSVATSGSTAVVGAQLKGAAYVFARSSGKWSQQAKLTARDAGLAFASSVALSGSTAVVGAPGKNSFTGAAYVFVGSSGTWSQKAELTASDGAANEEFGYSVALSGSTAVVGINNHSATATGAAYVFERSGEAWSQQAELTPKNGAGGGGFGYAVAVNGSTAVVGAPYENSNTGAAYVFAGSGTTWSQQAKLTASDAAVDDYLGSSVAVYGSTAVVGAPLKNSDTGAAYVFANL